MPAAVAAAVARHFTFISSATQLLILELLYYIGDQGTAEEQPTWLILSSL